MANETFSVTVERRMREWREHKERQAKHPLDKVEKINYITISRELGSLGEEVADILASLMDWGVFDKKILDFMAENFGIHKDVLETVDERTRSWIQECMESFFSNKKGHIDQFGYYRHLAEALLVIGRHGRAVIVGRAAGLLLPRESGISVRITAPFKLRCRRYAEMQDVPLQKAKAVVKEDDKNQTKFVKDFLNKDVHDPQLYDITCNSELLSADIIANIILRTYKLRLMNAEDLGESTPPDVSAKIEQH